jgi:hypothetical protein
MFEKGGYSKDDLMAIVSQINNISKEEFAKKYTDKSKLSFYISAGINAANTNSDHTVFVIDGAKSSYTSYLPFAAIGMDFNPSPESGAIELKVALSVAASQFSDTYKLNVDPYTPAKASYSQVNVSLEPEIIVNLYNATNLKFYLGAGGSVSYMTFTNPVFANPTPNTQSSFFPQEPYSFQKTSFSFLLTAGFKIHNNVEVFANYITSHLITGNSYFFFYESNIRIGASYFFGK